MHVPLQSIHYIVIRIEQQVYSNLNNKKLDGECTEIPGKGPHTKALENKITKLVHTLPLSNFTQEKLSTCRSKLVCEIERVARDIFFSASPTDMWKRDLEFLQQEHAKVEEVFQREREADAAALLDSVYTNIVNINNKKIFNINFFFFFNLMVFANKIG